MAPSIHGGKWQGQSLNFTYQPDCRYVITGGLLFGRHRVPFKLCIFILCTMLDLVFPSRPVKVYSRAFWWRRCLSWGLLGAKVVGTSGQFLSLPANNMTASTCAASDQDLAHPCAVNSDSCDGASNTKRGASSVPMLPKASPRGKSRSALGKANKMMLRRPVANASSSCSLFLLMNIVPQLLMFLASSFL